MPDDADSPHNFESLSSHDVEPPDDGPPTEPVEPIVPPGDGDSTEDTEPPSESTESV